ncbi:MAG: cytochrome c3 family protein, partial [Chthoniobacteraceae bacterium]
AAHSNVPTTQVCMNCHSQVQKENPKLALVRESWTTGKSIEWVQIHKTPDYVYFNHSAHVNRGVSCVSCHSRVDKMAIVYHAEPHSMAWCLDCHEAPQNFVRPVDKITDLNWEAPQLGDESKKKAQQRIGDELVKQLHLNPPVKNCAGCHR